MMSRICILCDGNCVAHFTENYLLLVYEVEGPRPNGRPKRTWSEVLENYCQVRKLNKEDAMDCNSWKMLIQDV